MTVDQANTLIDALPWVWLVLLLGGLAAIIGTRNDR